MSEEPVSEPTNEPDHAQVAPVDNVYLPQLVSDEFGTAPSIAREIVAMGKVEIDGEPWEGDPLTVPVDKIAGKDVKITGSFRSVRFHYNG